MKRGNHQTRSPRNPARLIRWRALGCGADHVAGLPVHGRVPRVVLRAAGGEVREAVVAPVAVDVVHLELRRRRGSAAALVYGRRDRPGGRRRRACVGRRDHVPVRAPGHRAVALRGSRPAPARRSGPARPAPARARRPLGRPGARRSGRSAARVRWGLVVSALPRRPRPPCTARGVWRRAGRGRTSPRHHDAASGLSAANAGFLTTNGSAAGGSLTAPAITPSDANGPPRLSRKVTNTEGSSARGGRLPKTSQRSWAGCALKVGVGALTGPPTGRGLP